MNNDTNKVPDYETTVRSSENLRDKMEGTVNEPNRFRSMENQERNTNIPENNRIQSVD